MLIDKPLYTALAIAIGVASAYPYLRDVLQGKTKPHLFTWFIWGVSAAIIFAAMLQSHAGWGAWVTGFFVLKCLVYCFFALKWGEKHITRSDWISLVICLGAIPLWMMTSNPLWSVILLVAIEAVAFFPTFRKSWDKPFEETLASYNWGVVQSALSLLALQTYSLTNTLYASSIIAQNTAFVIFVLWRRRLSFTA